MARVAATMDPLHLTLLIAAIACIALLYSSVGHAGASGYIAVMALFGIATADIRPIALFLNILVAVLGSFQFWRAGHFSWQLFWPFALLSVPAAYLGGYLHVPVLALRILLGVVLLVSAVRLIVRRVDPPHPAPPPHPIAIALGGTLGFLSGVTGTGGGIFLTPLLLLLNWAHIKQAAAVSAVFILVNSIAGLVGYLGAHQSMPNLAFILAGAALIGGAAGSYLGSRRLAGRTISLLLASVLVIAGLKLLFTR